VGADQLTSKYCIYIYTMPKMNAKVIEMIGPPGIGKTALYEFLCARWSPQLSWTCQEELLIPKPGIEDFKGWLGYNARKWLGKRLNKHISSDFGRRFINNHIDLCTFLWNLISGPGVYTNQELDMRYRTANNLFLDFCRYQAILEKSSEKPCLICEGFLQKSFLVQVNEESRQEVVQNYIKLLPLPYAVIYMNTHKSDIIVERLLARKKMIASQVGMDYQMLMEDIRKWSATLELVTSSLHSYNVPVYYIDGANPIQENAVIVQGLLESNKVLV